MNLERGLKAATENFCSQEVCVDLNAQQVKVVRLFLLKSKEDIQFTLCYWCTYPYTRNSTVQTQGQWCSQIDSWGERYFRVFVFTEL